jgi:hypothetical protein
LEGNYTVTVLNKDTFRINTTRKIFGAISGSVRMTVPSGNKANGIAGDQISLTKDSSTGYWKTSKATITWNSADKGVIFYIATRGIALDEDGIRITNVDTTTNTAQFQLIDGPATESKVITGNAYTYRSFGIRSSHNVDGITKSGTGRWVVSFKNNRTDNLYAAVGSCNDPSDKPDAAVVSVNSQTNQDVTISTTKISPTPSQSGYIDSTNISLVVFGL